MTTRPENYMKIKLDNKAKAYAPTRAHSTDAGLDLRSPTEFVIYPKTRMAIDTGVHVQLPNGTVGLIKSRSGLNVKHGILCEGVIDEGYTGSIVVNLYNHSEDFVSFSRGDKIAQLLIVPCLYETVEIVDDLPKTDRGDNGFGSTGRN